MDVRAEIVTRHYVGLYDDAVHLRLSADEFGHALDGLYTESFLEFWRTRPRDELVDAVTRFPTSRSLRFFLFALAREDGRREWLEVVRDASGRSGATAAARGALEAGHGRFAQGDVEGAADLFQQAINEDPTLGDAWNDLAVALDALDRPGATDLLAVA